MTQGTKGRVEVIQLSGTTLCVPNPFLASRAKHTITLATERTQTQVLLAIGPTTSFFKTLHNYEPTGDTR